jgi:hypothetical protein
VRFRQITQPGEYKNQFIGRRVTVNLWHLALMLPILWKANSAGAVNVTMILDTVTDRGIRMETSTESVASISDIVRLDSSLDAERRCVGAGYLSRMFSFVDLRIEAFEDEQCPTPL